jgi:predicted nucleic-acid-binding protein
MLAVDTNLIVRYLTQDTPGQWQQAQAVIDKADIFVSITVLLETAWVLRRTYGYDGIAVAKALRAFAGLPRVSIQQYEVVRQALDWTEKGLDFADALHLASAQDCEAFVTFDRRFLREASRVTDRSVRAP